MSKVSKRGGFSDRNNIKPINTKLQITEFDERTRVQLQNMISRLYRAVYKDDLYYGRDYIQNFLRFVLGSIYSEPVDVRLRYSDDKVLNQINETIHCGEYDDVLTVIEAILQYWDSYLKETMGYEYYDPYNKKYRSRSLFSIVNEELEREFVGYRFIDGIIVPISDTYELSALREALDTEYEPVYDHLSKANKYLADRDNPDYENSIKESISAVEAVCIILTGVKGKDATLGKMLKKIEDSGIQIHPGLKSAFNVLYGYASDANGIRHAGDIGGKATTFEEAKFMLVACSAFINYLIANAAKME